MVQNCSRSSCSLDRVRQDMTRIGSGLDRVNVLAENGYLNSLGHGLQIRELGCHRYGYSTISRDLISDFGEFNAPLACGFNVGLEVHKDDRGSAPFYPTQPPGSPRKDQHSCLRALQIPQPDPCSPNKWEHVVRY